MQIETFSQNVMSWNIFEIIEIFDLLSSIAIFVNETIKFSFFVNSNIAYYTSNVIRYEFRNFTQFSKHCNVSYSHFVFIEFWKYYRNVAKNLNRFKLNSFHHLFEILIIFIVYANFDFEFTIQKFIETIDNE